MSGYRTNIVAEAINEKGEMMARISVEHFGLDYEGLVKVEQSVKGMLDTQFGWGTQRVAEQAAKK